STWSGGNFLPFCPAPTSTFMSVRSLAAPSWKRPTPSAFRHCQTVTTFTPHQCWIAREDSVRTARASSSSTARPEPPPSVSSRRQRGHEIRASDQLVMTTVPSRNKHVVRSPLRRGGGVYGPCSSLTRSALRIGSVLALAGEPGADVRDEGRAGDARSVALCPF